MPSEPSVIRFYVALLAAMGAPLRPRPRLPEMEQLALALLRKVGVRMLVIDELHNVGRQQRQPPGIPQPAAFPRQRAAHPAGRGRHTRCLLGDPLGRPVGKPLRADDAAGVGGQRRLLLTAGQLRGFAPAAATLVDCHAGYGPLPAHAQRGTIGELAHLLMAAAVAAVESGEEAINHRTLSMADYTGPSERRRQFERELM